MGLLAGRMLNLNGISCPLMRAKRWGNLWSAFAGISTLLIQLSLSGCEGGIALGKPAGDNASDLDICAQKSVGVVSDPRCVVTVSSITPAIGGYNGGINISITGINFTAGSIADFGGVPCNNNTVISTTLMTCVLPAHVAGTVDVTVTTPDNNAGVASGGFVYTNSLVTSPTSYTLAVNDTYTFQASGGVPNYSFAMLSGGGAVNSLTGLYTAPAVTGSASIRVSDSAGHTANITITINPAVIISPATVTIAANDSKTFTTTGGVPPYTYSLFSGTGTMTSYSGVFVAAGSAGTSVVHVTDSLGNISSATITINPVLTISPTTMTVAVNDIATFTAAGGVSPYTVSFITGSGSVAGSTVHYTAPASSGTDTVQVVDSLGNSASATVTINPVLAIVPTPLFLAVTNNFLYSTTGGVGPFTYAVTSGGGTVGATTGYYTAPASTGTAIVTVTDSLGNTSASNITINPALVISPLTKTLAVNDTATFTATGGVTPYSFAMATGSAGTVISSTGVYTAPIASGTDTVVVTDARGNTSTATVTINPALAILPTSKTLAVNNTFTFTASGGVGTYVFALSSGTGSINSGSGLYTAPAAAGTASVKVTDSLGNTAFAVVTIKAALAISPASQQMAINNTFTFTGSAGVSPYTYSIFSGIGSVNANSGLYTAPGSTGTAQVRVTDSLGNTANATVTVNPALALNPASKTLAVGNSFTFGATGGSLAYAYSLLSGGGVMNPATGNYTAPGTSGTATVQVMDSLGNASSGTVTINPAISISPTTIDIAGGAPRTFSSAGGVPSDTYSVTVGGGSVTPATGIYTAPATTGTATIQVADSLGNIASAVATIFGWTTMDTYQLSVGNPSQAYAVGSDTSNNIFVAGSANDGTALNWIVKESTNAGGVWTTADSYQLKNNKASEALGFASDTLLNLFAGGYGIDNSNLAHWIVRKHPNAGAWSKVSDYQLNASYDSHVQAMFVDGSNNIFATGFGTDGNGVHWLSRRSLDNGTTWTTLESYQLQATKAAASNGFGIDNAGNLYTVGYAGDVNNAHWMIRRSVNGGNSWAVADNFQINVGWVAAAAAVGTDSAHNIYVVGNASDPGGTHWIVRKSTDNGISWSTVQNYQYSNTLAAQATGFASDGSGNVFVSGFVTTASGIRWITQLSRDGGTTWSVIDYFQNLSPNNSQANALSLVNGHFYGVGSGIDGNGTSWIVRKY